MLLTVSYMPHRVRQLSTGPYHYNDELWLRLEGEDDNEDNDAPAAHPSKDIAVRFRSSGDVDYCYVQAEAEPNWPEWIERLFGPQVRAIAEQLVAAGVGAETAFELSAADEATARPVWQELLRLHEQGVLVSMPPSDDEVREQMRPFVSRMETDPEGFEKLMGAMFGES